MQQKLVVWFNEVDMKNVSLVGGKIASLGEMIKKLRVPVPIGFSTTSHAFKFFLSQANLDKKIEKILSTLKKDSVIDLKKKGKQIRNLILSSSFPMELEKEILSFYAKMGKPFVAVRSSATLEDQPDASFAGQHETFLNVKGDKQLLLAIKKCMASLFTDRAIHYRIDKGFSHSRVSLAVGVQEMINSKASGVIFTLDPDSGFKDIVFINGTWGLGELIVGGKIIPDEFEFFKPTQAIISKRLGLKSLKLVRKGKKNVLIKTSKNERKKFVLSDIEVKQLSKFAIEIEKHYGHAMDIEWAKDSKGKLFILQARPETVHSRKSNLFEEYSLLEKGKLLLTGKSVGRKIGAGKVKVILSSRDLKEFSKGDILVTKMTEPDWEPIMKIASAIVTDKGGTTSHAEIVSRELGVPEVIGTNNATKTLKTGMNVTVDCTSEEGRVWRGKLRFSVKKINVKALPKTKTKVFMNISVPDSAFSYSFLPVEGVALARQEFIISSFIGGHPLWMIKQGKAKEFIEKLSFGIAKIAAAFYPKEVILRLSDFKSNEYAQLIGGKEFEIKEENPMLGFRGAIRYASKEFYPAFKLECEAIKKARNEMGLKNISLMVPFCRTVFEAKKVLELLKKNGLPKSKNLKVYMMAEIPSNIILAEEFAKYFDGFSIGSNDLTQLILGVGRDNERVAKDFDERNPAVLKSIECLIKVAHKFGKKVGICGDAPSKFPEYSRFLVSKGINYISVTPDMVVKTRLVISKAEKSVFKK
jgi:pyruvate,water dikinase